MFCEPQQFPYIPIAPVRLYGHDRYSFFIVVASPVGLPIHSTWVSVRVIGVVYANPRRKS